MLGGATSHQLPQAKEPRKVLKKKRKKKMKRRSRLSQLGGMSDVERSRWMLEHCKVACAAFCQAQVLVGLSSVQLLAALLSCLHRAKHDCISVKPSWSQLGKLLYTALY